MDAKARAAAHEYKVLKQAFYEGLNGGTVWEINQVTAVAASSVLLWSALQSRQAFFRPYNALAFAVDFLLNCAAILFATTLYSSHPLLLNALLALPAVFLLVTLRPSGQAFKKPVKKDGSYPIAKSGDSSLDPYPIKPFVTAYRGTMIVVTCVAILAVDFKVFPRRFAKVETWGTSLMDLGVGSFVFSSGTVSARAILKQRSSNITRPLASRLIAAARHSLPLLVLGLIRLYSVKGLDYHEHVTEYGVHWNFFFTLGLLPPFLALFDSAFGLLPSYAVFSLLLGAAYEIVLDFTDLKKFIVTAPRTDLLSQNREGVFSFFGYLAIFLAGQATGMYILPRARKSGPLRNSVLEKLIVWSIVWTSLAFLSTDFKYGLGLSVSRRLANLPYVLWVSAFNTAQLGLFCLVEAVAFPHVLDPRAKSSSAFTSQEASSKVLRSFNRNGLAIFLLGNLLTGLVNMTLPTLHMDHLQAMGVLISYMAILTGVAVALDSYNVSIKL